MSLGYNKALYVLAFDHRGSFEKMLGVAGKPDAERLPVIRDAKALIFEGLEVSLGLGIDPVSAGVLVDEQYGGDVPATARAKGLSLAMPVEKSGQDEFDFEYGDDFGAHIEAFDPVFSKVLVRHNPEGDPGMNARQTERLKRLADWLHAHERLFLFELLVPATADQLAKVGGDDARYDAEVRPNLMVEVIRHYQAAGVEADIWKIEGIDSRDDCRRLAAQARAGGRDGVGCVVLGRGASQEKVDFWLRQGAGLPGYIGFAIGRTIWSKALTAFRAGEIDRATAADQIAANYKHSIDVYEAAAAAS